jgi:protein ImuA
MASAPVPELRLLTFPEAAPAPARPKGEHAPLSARAQTVARLRTRIRQVERAGRPAPTALPFGVAALDHWLPEGGLRLGALHEVRGGGGAAGQAAAAVLFVAGILARLDGPVLWCLT